MSRFLKREKGKKPLVTSEYGDTSFDTGNDLTQRSQIGNGRCDNWQEYHKHCLIGLIQEQNVVGNVINGNPTSLAWNDITIAFNQKMAVTRSKQQLKDAWKNLKRDFRRYHDLTQKSGWGWNYTTQLPEATDDVWADLLQTNPEYRTLRYKPFPYYDAMDTITKNTFALGHHSRSSHYPVMDTYSPTDEPTEEQTVSGKRSSEHLMEVEHSVGRRRRTMTKTAKDRVLEESEECRKYATMAIERAMSYSLQDTVAKLNLIPNISDIGYMAVSRILEKHLDKRTLFMMVPEERLQLWINTTVEECTDWKACDLWRA